MVTGTEIPDDLDNVRRSICASILMRLSRTSVCNYLADPRNMVDVVLFLLEIVGLAALISWEDLEWQRGLLATWCIVKWFRVMYSLRGFELFGPRILPILSALKDTTAFLILMGFCLLSFTHAFYALGTHDNLPHWIYGAFLPVFRLGVIGDSDLDELAGVNTVFGNENGIWAPQDPDPLVSPMYTYVLMLYLFANLVITVLMMNILVGILGANYERYEEQSQVLFVRERARMITILSARPYTRHVWNQWGDEDFLYFATKATPNTEDERSTRRAIQISNEEALRQQSASLEAAFEVQVRRQNESIRESIREQNESLESKMMMELDAKFDAKFDAIVQILKALERD